MIRLRTIEMESIILKHTYPNFHQHLLFHHQGVVNEYLGYTRGHFTHLGGCPPSSFAPSLQKVPQQWRTESSDVMNRTVPYFGQVTSWYLSRSGSQFFSVKLTFFANRLKEIIRDKNAILLPESKRKEEMPNFLPLKNQVPIAVFCTT